MQQNATLNSLLSGQLSKNEARNRGRFPFSAAAAADFGSRPREGSRFESKARANCRRRFHITP
jgi:hypothetical protein